MTPLSMTRFEANQILNRWRMGLQDFPPHVICWALYMTGDLRGELA